MSPKSQLSAQFKVKIFIRDFPIELWNFASLKGAISSFGNLVCFAKENPVGTDKAIVKACVMCPSLRLIPKKMLIGMGWEWAQCPIEIESWAEARKDSKDDLQDGNATDKAMEDLFNGEYWNNDDNWSDASKNSPSDYDTSFQDLPEWYCRQKLEAR